MTRQKRIEFLKLKLTEDLVAILVDEKKMSIEEGFATLYHSNTYAKLSDPNTQLYFQSPGYVYSLLEEELTA